MEAARFFRHVEGGSRARADQVADARSHLGPEGMDMAADDPTPLPCLLPLLDEQFIEQGSFPRIQEALVFPRPGRRGRCGTMNTLRASLAVSCSLSHAHCSGSEGVIPRAVLSRMNRLSW